MLKFRFALVASIAIAIAIAIACGIYFVSLGFVIRYEAPIVSRSAVLVTGCSTGIGLHIARELSQKGFFVYATIRNPSDASVLNSTNILPVIMDVTKKESITYAYKTISRDLSQRCKFLAAVVNNAGVAHINALELMDLDELRHVLEVNVVGVVSVTQTFLPLLRTDAPEPDNGNSLNCSDPDPDSDQQSCGSAEDFYTRSLAARVAGRVIVIGSAAGFVTPLLYGAYAASKYAVEAITDAFRMELHSQNISVSIVEPGTISETAIRYKNSGENTGWNRNRDRNRDKSDSETPGSVSPRRYYEPIFKSLFGRAAALESMADPPSLVSEAVLDAIISVSPKTRYPVGHSSGMSIHFLRILVGLLPDRAIDFMKLRTVR